MNAADCAFSDIGLGFTVGWGGGRRLHRVDRARFRSLFAEGARLISIRVTPEGGTPAVMTVEDYAKRAGANFEINRLPEASTASR
jgi:hypothetical protein